MPLSRPGVPGGDGGALRSSAAAAAGVPPLVNNGKSADPPSLVSLPVSPVITDKTDPEFNPRALRYVLQQTARKLLGPTHPTHSCHWWLARGAEEVLVSYSPSRGVARYRQVMTCGSVWACPVCSAPVSERRAGELRSALSAHSEAGGTAGFATFTVSHAHDDALETVLDSFLAAFRYLTSKPSYKRLRARWGVVGYVRVLEVTYGRNGWHVHAHVLYFFEGKQDAGTLCRFEDELFPLWESAASRSGLLMSRRYGLEVRPAYGTVEEYLAKFGKGPRWDISREMAKGHLKTGRSIAGLRSLTPWELLLAAHEGDTLCGVRFREYALRFQGRAQLYWSPGLRKRFQLDETPASDHTLASAAEPDDCTAGGISSPEWESVKRASARARLLELVEGDKGGWTAAAAFLKLVVEHYPPHTPRPRGALSEDFRQALDQLHREQDERNRWRGPLSVSDAAD